MAYSNFREFFGLLHCLKSIATLKIRRTDMRKTYRIPAVSSGGIGNEVARVPVKATSLLKTILLGAGLAVATATPSLAQSYDASIGTGNIVPFYGQTAQSGVTQGAGNAYARILPRSARGARNAYARIVPGATASQSWNLYNEQGNVFGTDPDPNIRFQLHRESLQGRW
jgi:hypothetical protein